ncbi:MAG: HesA/MoeB/ThiF family protein [Methanosarcinales archaeon]|nr:HesA/MoeB/ThiF family protein [Methanosarcinales archaeon]
MTEHSRAWTRYARQVPLLGQEGQERLSGARVLVAGAGGLGSVVSLYLAAAGVGRLRIVDQDVVEVSNLNRQIIYREEDLGRGKADRTSRRLMELNSEIEVEPLAATIDRDNVMDLAGGCDLIVDAMDSFQCRYLLNDAALRRGMPLVHGAVSGFHGQATTVVPGRTACLRCIFPRAPPKVAPPVLGATCGIIGSIQATEAVKCILGMEGRLENRLLIWDGVEACMDQLGVERNDECPACSQALRRRDNG